ncbi:MAG: aminomethyl-transferring glycine dehydrogenase subunit GcvPB [Candidatus Eisenbacteria bacterium]|uniref:glycine dehydrogenase (aminomethyl-transferring) n=1 Tax=Eiseniibacteriota bacterium TaxID=2212470 RepID=A0A948RSR8_UNCEI|nr:aminomethyl-transferring glycine dehydrogenase subunit GcvPB [Candidatus Eisenbacteria bacterium]MBU1947673.1 aminomethyl-transferring glycine dehydrogenase subunit GcvPB [Candidatus Eisenbacteria bacterium]MBU2690333.1 aminomethyl-transferring glycine dehydrogenase subunit GcvPB [Candidatus Eisenbacteria bacterium]
MNVELIFEKSRKDHRGHSFPKDGGDKPALDDLIPERHRRSKPPRLPEVTESEVVRHYIKLSALNFHVDKGMYPLGSCTMKYNPKVHEDLANINRFAGLHPCAPVELCQGTLEMLYRFSEEMSHIMGMDALSLQPSAGAQGEMLGMKLVAAYHKDRGLNKKTVLIPDSAHGTNPASVAVAGFTPVEIPSGPDGRINLEATREKINDETAAIIITNPNTLGIFERDMPTIARWIHEVDGLVYMDGANLNALVGWTRPGDLGADIVHINLHKTFSTPHGGGGPGAGPIGVKAGLIPFLPIPGVIREGAGYALDWNRPKSVGKIHPFMGNVGVILRAWAYMRTLGAEGLAAISRAAIVNANYLLHLVKEDYSPARPGPCMHEFVITPRIPKEKGLRNTDVAKRLLDFGFYAPTVSFPLIVHEALMVEPTESERQDTLERYAAVLKQIAKEAVETPQTLKDAPTETPVGRLDEAAAARRLKLRWEPEDAGETA